jgi:hypothetical protein
VTLLERYLNGERDAVWAELRAAEESVREEPLFSEAQAVLREAMTRVRRNIQTIVTFLEGEGYRFGTYPQGDTPLEGVQPREDFSDLPLGMPLPDVLERMKAFEAEFGAIPLSLKMFWEVVGSVNLVGHHPDWYSYSNPLWVEAIDGALEMAIQEYEDQDMRIPIAPDIYHKDNVSGGEGYYLNLPNNCFDGAFWYEDSEVSFLEFLRINLEYAGFPGCKFDLGANRAALEGVR